MSGDDKEGLTAVEDNRRILTIGIKRAVLARLTTVLTLSIVDTGQRVWTAVLAVRVNNGVALVNVRTEAT